MSRMANFRRDSVALIAVTLGTLVRHRLSDCEKLCCSRHSAAIIPGGHLLQRNILAPGGFRRLLPVLAPD